MKIVRYRTIQAVFEGELGCMKTNIIRLTANRHYWRYLSVEAIAFLCTLLFAYAAITKLWDYEKFVVQLGQSPLLTGFAGFVAWFIPSIELIIAVAIQYPRTRTAGLYGFFGLMAMFTTYIIILLNFSDNIPCSCGGVLEKLGWEEHLIFNIAFTILAAAAILLQHGLRQQQPPGIN